ncbi:hypothetical protein LZ554_003946 [Drepanopeziza brunnea f. sp. 'monogermtubi']|nr:hypothetical protein LZ554_003946 [Drepanopeziza brunnea f. sp. 'monogermtubi']
MVEVLDCSQLAEADFDDLVERGVDIWNHSDVSASGVLLQLRTPHNQRREIPALDIRHSSPEAASGPEFKSGQRACCSTEPPVLAPLARIS